MIHAKKVRPEYFEAASKGSKPFEVRLEDPNEPAYVVGDLLALNECEEGKHSEAPHYSGRCMLFLITYVLRDFELLPKGVVVLGLRPMVLTDNDCFSPI